MDRFGTRSIQSCLPFEVRSTRAPRSGAAPLPMATSPDKIESLTVEHHLLFSSIDGSQSRDSDAKVGEIQSIQDSVDPRFSQSKIQSIQDSNWPLSGFFNLNSSTGFFNLKMDSDASRRLATTRHFWVGRLRKAPSPHG